MPTIFVGSAKVGEGHVGNTQAMYKSADGAMASAGTLPARTTKKPGLAGVLSWVGGPARKITKPSLSGALSWIGAIARKTKKPADGALTLSNPNSPKKTKKTSVGGKIGISGGQ